MWSESRLKNFLESRGVDVPQYSKKDELVAYVKANKNKHQSKYGMWTFQDWSVENLRNWLAEQGHNTADYATASRDELVNSANSALASASSAGESTFATITAALAQATNKVKGDTFETWSDSDLKAYLDSYGIKTYQGSNRNQLLAEVRRQAYLFRNGGSEPGVWEKTNGLLNWAKVKAWTILGLAKDNAQDAADKASDKAAEATDYAKTRSEL